jgi:hypothetical protein
VGGGAVCGVYRQSVRAHAVCDERESERNTREKVREKVREIESEGRILGGRPELQERNPFASPAGAQPALGRFGNTNRSSSRGHPEGHTR